MDLEGKIIAVTGGTGSFGSAFIRMTLAQFNPRKIIVISRDEIKQWELQKEYKNESRLVFAIADVRDLSSLSRVLSDVDYIIHAAAAKIVKTGELNPIEFVKTNILGTINVIDCSIALGIKKIIGLSTDKASSPISLYGATKLTLEKLFMDASSRVDNVESIFSVIRYGNMIGSRSSVVPFFLESKGSGTIPITDMRVTRFMISLKQAVELSWMTLEDMLGGEIYVGKTPSLSIVELANIIAPEDSQKITGLKPGEKLHEQLIGSHEAPYTYEYQNFYKILPSLDDSIEGDKRIKGGKKVPDAFIYNSSSNTDDTSIRQIRQWINTTH